METKNGGIPAHVAIVMDGNGRWAQKKKLPRIAGHNAGMIALKDIVKASDQMGIKYLTVYAFSTENWKRPADEVGGIFKLLIIYVEKELAELHANNVKVHILGDYEKLPADSVSRLNKALEMTKDNTGLQFNIALNYGGRNEILKAVQSICMDAADHRLDPQAVTEEELQKRLYTWDLPDPDLVIRTSGEMRLSNFLLWQSAYSEFWFTETLWPDFKKEHLEEAVAAYQSRKRRFGGI